MTGTMQVKKVQAFLERIGGDLAETLYRGPTLRNTMMSG